MKVNLGCGSDYRRGWLNIDNDSDVKADLHLDINAAALPEKAEYIYTDNVLEHIDDVGIKNIADSLLGGGDSGRYSTALPIQACIQRLPA